MYPLPEGPPYSDSSSHIRALIPKIEAGDAAAIDELYLILGHGLRWYFQYHHLQIEVAKGARNVLASVVEEIRNGAILDAQGVVASTRTLAHELLIRNRPRRIGQGHEGAFQHQKAKVMKQVLSEMTNREREILSRFYTDRQTQQRICREFDLVEAEFMQLKLRARMRFDEIATEKVVLQT